MASRFSIILLCIFFCTFRCPATVRPQLFDTIGLYALGRTEPNLTGTGVNAAMLCRSENYNGTTPSGDYRIDVSHNCFSELNVKFHDSLPGSDNSRPSFHATAIASILVGLAPEVNSVDYGLFDYEGGAPDINLSAYEFRCFLTDNVFPAKAPSADMLLISLGWPVETWWTRGIDAMAFNSGLLVISSAGNGTDAGDLPLYPASGYNVISVGVADSNGSLTDFNAPVATHSTFGFTADYRCKPDIIAPSNCLVAFNSGYAVSGDYTSFAVPVVASAASVLLQKAKETPALSFASFPIFRNVVLKSILMTSARKLSGWHKGTALPDDDFFSPLDLSQGAGMIDVLAGYEVLTAGMFISGDVNSTGWSFGLSPGCYRFSTSGISEPQFTATLNWNCPYQPDYPFRVLTEQFADLRLELYLIDSQSGKQLIDYSDSASDNVEHIYCPSLQPDSTYELTVLPSFRNRQGDAAASTVYGLSWRTSGSGSSE